MRSTDDHASREGCGREESHDRRRCRELRGRHRLRPRRRRRGAATARPQRVHLHLVEQGGLAGRRDHVVRLARGPLLADGVGAAGADQRRPPRPAGVHRRHVDRLAPAPQQGDHVEGHVHGARRPRGEGLVLPGAGGGAQPRPPGAGRRSSSRSSTRPAASSSRSSRRNASATTAPRWGSATAAWLAGRDAAWASSPHGGAGRGGRVRAPGGCRCARRWRRTPSA